MILSRNKLIIFCICCIIRTGLANSYPDLRVVLNSQINNAIIDVPKGTYSLDLLTNPTFTFSGKKNVTIKGNGSTVICNNQKQCFNFSNCENVVFKNFIIDYDPPCSTQGTITSISPDRKTWNVEIHDGYPIDSIENRIIQVFDQTTLELIRNYHSSYSIQINRIGTRTISISGVSDDDNSVLVGNYVTLNVRGTGKYLGAHAVVINACKNMLLDSITLYDSNSFAFYEYDCESTHYSHCVVTRKPFDPQYSIQHLKSATADGIHSSFAKTGPIIEACKLEYTGDDCIAIHSRFYPVYDHDSTSTSVYLLTPTNYLTDFKMSVGDSIICIANDASVRGKAVITSISPLSVSPTQDQISTCYSNLGSVISKSNYGIAITVDKWIRGLADSDILYSKNRSGEGFQVINNQVGHNRSRGILIKSSNGIVSGNNVTNCAMSGIACTSEFQWMGGGVPSNIVIDNNLIQNCMFDGTMSSISSAGALSVETTVLSGKSYAAAGVLSNYSISNNVINGCPRPCVVLASIENVNYVNNTINPDLNTIRKHGSLIGVKNTNDLWMISVKGYSSNFTELQNISTNPQNNILIDSNGNLSISNIPNGHITRVMLYDLTGRLKFDKKLSASDSIQIGSLSKGIYSLLLRFDNTNYINKILVF